MIITPLLGGNVDRRDEELAELKREIAALRERNIDLEAEMVRQRRESQRAIAQLRQILTPLRNGILQIFGEMDAIGGEAETVASPATASSSKWDAVKARLAPRVREAIDILLIHGTMNTRQLAAAMRMDRSNCGTNVVGKLKTMGLIIKNGNEFSLKQL